MFIVTINSLLVIEKSPIKEYFSLQSDFFFQLCIIYLIFFTKIILYYLIFVRVISFTLIENFSHLQRK